MKQMKLPKSHVAALIVFCAGLFLQGMAQIDQTHFAALYVQAGDVPEDVDLLGKYRPGQLAAAAFDTCEGTEQLAMTVNEIITEEEKKKTQQDWCEILDRQQAERERKEAEEAARKATEEAAARKAAEEAAARRAAAAQAAAQAQAQAQTQGNFALVWPVPASHTVTSGFGPRPDLPIAGVSPYHNGIDIGAPQGTPIVAAADGVVWYVGDGAAVGSNSGGLQVWIHHEGGRYTTTYMHASQILVGAGQTVKAGDVIALVGSTGASTGPHLDFRIMCGGGYVNPLGGQVNYIQ